MLRVTLLALLLAGPAFASEGSRDVRLLDADQAKACTAVGTVTNSHADHGHPDDATQKALATAMDAAAKSGANAAVISDASDRNNRQTVVLQTYRCGAAIGVSATN
jgi:hypothetical protein